MRQIVWGVLLTGLVSTSALAQEPAGAAQKLDLRGAMDASFSAPAATIAQGAPAADPKVKVTGGVDFPTSYFFRGYRQESDPELTVQPYVDVGVAAAENVALNIGLWNSAHTGSLSDAGAGWYETDFYAALTMGIVKATYTAYTYPKIDDSTIHELMFSSTFGSALAPSVAVAFELSKANGLDKGIYFEGGIAPGIPLGDGPVSLTVPVKVGLSLKDYYGDDTFGYFDVGVNFLAPIAPNFDIHGGAHVLTLGDVLKDLNNGDRAQFIGSVGLGFSF